MIVTTLALFAALQAAPTTDAPPSGSDGHPPAAAPSRHAAPQEGPLTPEQTLAVRQLSDPQVSPDGRRVAFVVTGPPDGDKRPRAIWMLDVASREVRRLTWSEGSDTWPRWSPDGRTLAFLSDRGTGTQIYLLPMAGGEAAPLTHGKGGTGGFEWSPDGRSIAFVASEPRSDEEEKKVKDKDDARVVDEDDRHARAWVVDVATNEVRRLTKEPWSIGQITWMPGGDALVAEATDRPASEEETDQVVRIALGDGAVTVVASPKGPFGDVTVSPDGGALAWVAARVDGPTPHDLWTQRLGSAAPRNLTAGTLDRPVSGVTWRPDGHFMAVVADGFKSRLEALDPDGEGHPLAQGPVNPSSYSARGGTLAFTGETTTEAPELWVSVKDGPPTRVTSFNADWKHPSLVAPTTFTYRSFDGTPIEAAVLMPPGRPAGSKPPLVVLVHGGPTGRWSDRFESWGQLLVARGYAVLYPNIRGSSGYGFDFLVSNRADWGGGDYKDVMAGVDTVIARGLVDPDRVGIGGWSYGGYMSEWAITQTRRFKAAVVGAGLADLASEFGTENGPSYDEWFWGLPYEKLDGFVQHSPVTFAKNVRTPTLILQGTEDTTDPQGQSDQLYRPLKRYGVDVEYVLYPREPHGLREEKHLLDRLNRILDWYGKHLMGG
jgi:dipeptidyl aminopeptidase/acylaminoacyl peptidase